MAKVELDFDVSAAAETVEAAADDAVQRLAQGLYLLGETALTLAKEACPVRTGFLRSTHWMGEPIVRGTRIEVHMGAWASYAWQVHELHPTKAGWFTNAAHQVASSAEERLARWLRGQG